MKLYAVALFAQKKEYGKVISAYGARYCSANNENEAIGLCFRECQKDFPNSAGWNGHGVNVEEIPVDVMYKVIAE